MDERRMLEIVEQFSRQSYPPEEAIKITRVPDQKTVFVEQISGDGRAIIMTEYEVDGKIYWAGFSTQSQAVYVSLA